ncbi:AsmA family protein [Marinobacter sp. M216]|uniref:AsmA family protein n=1 Tax=Marinobacter albus TaxID=3030833 RepID=A0ABT7H9V1_9GAMM|nr:MULTISPECIES: AsmA family protein [unclassified Marinobacter]MBW7471050.1 AsmA family protein [Marinobacter sp. F4218]MDK9556670.1 AsmA family protein [Marinobacter sp. M216]
MKAVRYLLIAVIALILLAVVAVAVAMAVINPNDYKPQIEQAVEKQTNLDLVLEGDIGWSFIPLGLELNNVQANLEGNRFVALEQMVAQLDFWSLISMSPQVDTFVLSGLEANLEVNEQGQGNWTRIMPEPAESDAEGESQTAQAELEQQPEPAGEETGGEPLNFNVDNVEISNAQVHYTDKSTGQSVTLENFNVNASQITLGSEFPLDISFRVETAKPQFEVDGSISARLAANEALNDFAVSGLKAVFDMNGEPFGGKSVTAELTGSAQANLENETATLSEFTASFANLSMTTDLDVKGFGDKPALSGSINVEEFSLKDLLNQLGQPAVPTSDPDVLNALAFSTKVGGEPGKVALSDLTLILDDTTFAGTGSYNLTNSAIVFNLQGDKLNADRYLPPKSEDDAKAGESDAESEDQTASAKAAQSAPESDLLPLETLRTLLLDIDFGLAELIVSNLTINEIKASTTAKDGLIKVDEFSGKLYEGSFGANVSLDARSDNPKWKIGSDVKNVQTLPLLTDLAEVDMLSGGANLKVNVTTTGNRVSVLREKADGQISFNLAEGQFRNMNLTRMACQGIAIANQEDLSTTDWGTTTPFNDMRGTLDINGNILKNTDLVAALAGMKLEGDGTIDLKQTTLDYEAGLRIVGEIHRDEACRVTEYVENVVIPVECRGNFSEDPAGLCSFDGSRFRDTLKTIASNAAKAKAREEVDRATDKAEKKIQEKLEEELGDKLKGLFK